MTEPTPGTGLPSIRGFRNFERIGQGGSSLVFKAEQINLGRPVAVKLLFTGLIDDSQVRRFTNECQILGRLGVHRNIVDVYDADVTHDGRPYIVMKFYGRGSLGDRIRVEGPMPAREVISVGIKMTAALLAAHEIGVIHRDVKPDNILVDDNGEPVLTDFGVAAVVDGSGRFTTSIAFSQAHAAPEVLDGNAFGHLSDIYSLGSTLYTLLTGRAAFEADTEVRQYLAIMHAEPPAIDIPQVPQQLVEVIFTAMNKDRDARFPDAGAMATALEAIVYPTLAGGKDPKPIQTRIAAPATIATSVAAVDDEATRIRPSTRPPVEPASRATVTEAAVVILNSRVAEHEEEFVATVIRPSTKPAASAENSPTVVKRPQTIVSESAPPATGVYAVGDIGPGGGTVFYVAGSQQPWGRYLEAAPSGWSGVPGDPRVEWCNQSGDAGLGTAIGTGSSNTAAIARLGSRSAAQQARGYQGGGQSDWFLPSKDELDALYRTRGSVGGFARDYYWSSSQYGPTSAWLYYFATGYQDWLGRNFSYHVRPIRTF